MTETTAVRGPKIPSDSDVVRANLAMLKKDAAEHEKAEERTRGAAPRIAHGESEISLDVVDAHGTPLAEAQMTTLVGRSVEDIVAQRLDPLGEIPHMGLLTPEQAYIIIKLHGLDEESKLCREEIARDLGLSLSQVSHRYAKATAILRQAYTQDRTYAIAA